MRGEMPYLIAHEDDCEILKTGPIREVPIGDIDSWRAGERSPTMKAATLCSCGGVKVSVPVWTPSTTGITELDFPSGSPV